MSYKPVAKWSALSAAVMTGMLYVAFLIVLGLFADLMVSQGRIPADRDSSHIDREAFQQSWGQGLTSEERQQRLQDVGVAEIIAGELAAADFAKLGRREQALLWRAHVRRLLHDRVDPLAAALTLPDFWELPKRVQAVFSQAWEAAPVDIRRQKLGILGEEKAAQLAARDPARLDPQDLETLWRAHLYQLVKEQTNRDDVAAAFWNERARIDSSDERHVGRSDQELSDRGVLSLVVRSQNRWYGPVVGWLARWCPWMWRWGRESGANFYYYLSGLLAVGVGLALVRALALFVLNYAAALAAIEACNRMRRAVYHHTFRLGRLAFRALGPSEAVGVFTRQLETLHNGLYIWLTVIFREPVKFGLLLLLALAVNFWLALAFLGFVVLVWLIGGQVAVYFRRQERIDMRQSADQLALLQESLMMMRLVKCYLMELFNQARVERQLSKYAGVQLRRYRGEAIYRPLLVFLGTLSALVLFTLAGLIVLNGRLGIASAIVLATALVSLYLPLVNWLEERRLLRKAREAADVVFKFLDRPGEVGQAVGAEFLPPLANMLEFEDVSLQEPGTGRKLLQSINLTIQAGQRVALMGPDEMQKHALVYLIPRFLDPTSGEVRIDQHNLRWVTFDSLRAQIAMVLQHNLVFNDTAANNIGCGDPSYNLPKIIEAAKVAHAHHFIQKLPQGYETVIGEMGHYLNSGEQFRVALARALLREPALFIVEEPLAALDEETKTLLDDTFARVLPGRTVIFLPHRISTIRSCNRVFFLHRGRIDAAGEHRELLAQNDLYKHLHYIEFNEFAEQL